VPEAAFATVTLVGGRWVRPSVWCPGDAVPALDVGVLRARAMRLAPRVGIGSAWSTTALVNAEAVLWAGTSSERALGSVMVVGRRVGLRVSFAQAAWDFGDGQQVTAGSPGRAYDAAGDPCATAQCPDYFGHTYARTGRMTITLTVRWRARFSLDGGAHWIDITGDITGATSHRELTVKQARGVLVPNSGEH
jgi:hypothetical protein